MAPFTLEEVVVISLRDAKAMNAPVYRRAMDRFSKMRESEGDGVDGVPFIEWVEENISHPDPSYDTYVLVNNKTEEIVGTGSLLPDDQDVGKTDGIPGLWVGGVWTPKEHRGNGMNVMLRLMAPHIQQIADRTKKPVQVNFFTDLGVTEAFGKRYGATKLGDYDIPHIGKKEAVWFVKAHPSTK